jgi:hypothetical protein
MTLPLRKSPEEIMPPVDANDSPSVEQSPIAEREPSATIANQGERARPTLLTPHTPSTNSAPVDPETVKQPETTLLFQKSDLEQFQRRWDQIQTAFVDQPQEAVRGADELVTSAIQRLSEVFETERSQLEQRWGNGESPSTEDLRLALRRYRSFFRRILAV